jgi:hypothetical protein
MGLRDDSGQWSQSVNMSPFSGESSWLCGAWIGQVMGMT